MLEIIHDIVGPAVKKPFRGTVVMDKQLAEKSFTSAADGVLRKLAERITGAAGKTIGETVVESTNVALRPAAEQVINFLVSSKVGDSDNTPRSLRAWLSSDR